MTGFNLDCLAQAVAHQLTLSETDPEPGERPAGHRRAPRRQRGAAGLDLAGMAAAVEEQLALLNRTDAGVAAARGWVPVTDVAWGTYGTTTGIDQRRRALTVTGYIIHSHPLRGGPGGRGGDAIAVYVTDQPDGDHADAQVVYTDPAAMFTVLDPPSGCPAGEAAPWTRMPIEDQVIAAGDMVGLPVTVVPGPSNPLYQVGDDPPTALSRAADYLLAGGYLHSLGSARPMPHPNRLAEALTTPGGTR